MRIDAQTIEEAAKELYIRALKILPDDVKRGFDASRSARPRTAKASWAR
jgi:fumarate hydratase subunit alpha/L(+)-tartrate dehydratase alpha subunit